MKKATSPITVGIDLGDKKHAVCALDEAGQIIAEASIPNHREGLERLSTKYPGALMVMEVGVHSPWVSRHLSGLGHEVIAANPRKVKSISSNIRKCDRNDALLLARLARADRELLCPVRHRDEQSQLDLLQVKLRDNLVRRRADIISSVRFTLKSLGLRLGKADTACFARRCRGRLAETEPRILAMVEPSLSVIEAFDTQVRELDRAIEQICGKYPVTALLRQVGGVGPITSLVYVLVTGGPGNFGKARDVGAYLGLVPRLDQSGQSDKELCISKAGNVYLRRLLVSAAQYILGPFGPDCELRRHGLALAAGAGCRPHEEGKKAAKGSRIAKRKAVVAVARKLAVLLMAMWRDGKPYRPLRDAA